ncbi:RRM domain-containing protein [Caenorhabditis elegans]|nr:RRM domain-containing protein [Caenorhabditis elegans]CDK13518.1 RRM domain-containing protein [Caenorhabditis elegans]|eukprot:NP_001293232.1 RNP (RRM RNA binding domain) containing [Caenorhabditis elegans]
MIVSTGNLRINPTNIDHHDEPAPWSPLKRLRAESGSLSTAQVASPEFSPIKPKTMEFHETEDDVFETGPPPTYLSEGNENAEKKCVEQPKINYDDINNSRLPSNSHSAAPNSEKKHFVFPEYPMCRHSSVPSIAHLVGDLSDFCPHATADEKMLLDEASSIIENTTPAVSTAPAAAPGATMLQI